MAPTLLPLTFALSKGRILDETLPLLEKAGVTVSADYKSSRKLIIPTDLPNVRIIIVRASDVPTFVEHGAADLGVAGKDILVEHGGKGLYEPLDLKIACCRLMVAQKVHDEATEKSAESPMRRLKVATKYPKITQRFYAERGEQVELIKLYGSMELAPLVGLAHRIVDIVDTGNTLRANGLEPTDLIMPISARLVVNKGAMIVKHRELQSLIEKLSQVVSQVVTSS
jgi:ATP phosphoribosyltransferase